MNGKKQVVVWLDWLEWQQVYNGFFSKHQEEDEEDLFTSRRNAICKVAAWRTRGELPIAIESTCQLMELFLHEEMANKKTHQIGTSTRSHMELSLQYSCVIVRCVNGLVDSFQKGTYAQAVSGLAQRIGIPLWIVDLRHESTHNQLPTLQVLRLAAQHLLKWLESNYWLPQYTLLRTKVQKIGNILQSQEEKEFDIDQLRTIVVPLLVYGEQYEEIICENGNGLLFQDEQDPLHIQMDQWAALILGHTQTKWYCLSGWLLTFLIDKVFNIARFHQFQDKETLFDSLEVKRSFVWIKMLIENDWREKLKHQSKPIQEIYTSGTQALVQCEKWITFYTTKKMQISLALLNKLRSLLKTCKGIKTQYQYFLLSQKSNRENILDTGCPLGLTQSYLPMHLCHLDQEIEIKEIEIEIEIEEIKEIEEKNTRSKEIEIDQVMETLDQAYLNQIQTFQKAKNEILEEILDQGKSKHHHKLVPPKEIQRIQQEIELW